MVKKAGNTVSRKSWGDWQDWLGLALLFSTLEIAIVSIERARWISPQPSLSLVLALTLLTGWLLWRVKIPAVFGHLGLLMTGTAAITWQAAGMLPGTSLLPRVTRLFTIAGEILDSPQMIQSTYGAVSFAVFLLLTTWLIGYISVWSLSRRHNALPGVGVGAAALLVNLANLSEHYYYYVFVYILSALLLIGVTGLERHSVMATRRFFSRRSVFQLAAGLLAIILVSTTVAWYTPGPRLSALHNIFNSPAGWTRDIEQSRFNIFAAVPAKQLSLKSDSQGILVLGGVSFDEGEDIYFTISTSKPYYWRTRMYDIYESWGWSSGNVSASSTWHKTLNRTIPDNKRVEANFTVTPRVKTDIILSTGEYIATDVPALVRALLPLSPEINLTRSEADVLLPPDIAELADAMRSAPSSNGTYDIKELRKMLPPDLVITDASSESPRRASTQAAPLVTAVELTRQAPAVSNTVSVNSPALIKAGERYRVTSMVSTATADELVLAGDEYPHWVTDFYLQLPGSVTERVRKLSETVTRDAGSPYDKAIALQRYLSQLRYKADVSKFPEKADAVDHFLFVEKTGNCGYFASAMAVMLRAIGVPTRLIVGYLPGEWDASAGQAIVRSNEYHAWVDVYFPGYGWIEFDPTPSGQEDELEDILPSYNRGGSAYSDDDFEEDDEFYYYGSQDTADLKPTTLERLKGLWPWSFPFAAVVVAGLVWRWLLSLKSVDPAAELYGKLCRLAAAARLGPARGQTPSEYFARLTTVFPEYTGALGVMERGYLASRYGNNRTFTGEQLGELTYSWRQVYPALIKKLFSIK